MQKVAEVTGCHGVFKLHDIIHFIIYMEWAPNFEIRLFKKGRDGTNQLCGRRTEIGIYLKNGSVSLTGITQPYSMVAGPKWHIDDRPDAMAHISFVSGQQLSEDELSTIDLIAQIVDNHDAKPYTGHQTCIDDGLSKIELWRVGEMHGVTEEV
jgi:hypothetical protein